MPSWWKGRSSSKAKTAAAAEEKRKASSFDEAVGAGRRPVVRHPLPRPASVSSPQGVGSASGSSGSSSLGSSAASDEAPDLGFCRLADASNMSKGRTLVIDPRKQHHVVDDGRLFSSNQALEHPRLSEASVSPRKELQLQAFDLPNGGAVFSHGRRSAEIVFSTRTPSSPPSSRGHPCPTSPVHSRAFGPCPGSPTARQDDARSSSSPHPLPRPPSSPNSSSRSPQSQWKKGKLLGSGTFGHVYLGFNSEGGQMCAIKEVKVISDDSNSKECLKQLNQEIVLLSKLSHPNIVRYFSSELSDETLSVYLEYVSGGSIHKLLQEYGPFGEAVIRNYTGQILSGLAYLHARNTVHRDIKGANILVDPNGDIKLADFGMAKHISSYTSIKSFKGSPYWMAPEVIMNGNGYNLSVDIWSLGCTILEMATSKPPWSQYEGVAAIFKIGNSKDIPDIPDHFSAEAKNFLKLCLQRDPAARPTAAQLMDHPFVKDQATIRGSRSGTARDMVPSPSDGNRNMVQASIEFPSYRSISPLRDLDLRARNLPGPSSAVPLILTQRKSVSSLLSARINMSLPVSPSSSPLRQFRLPNRSCLPSPPHPAYSAGAANYSPINNVLYPMLEISHLKEQTSFDSPRRL